MLSNYIITAWKVFLRRKFFTFINLFGISITLMVLVVTSTIADNYFYPAGPEKNVDNFRTINRLLVTNDEENLTSVGRLGYKFIKDNVFRLQTPELISINSGTRTRAIFHEGLKRELLIKKTDSNFWRILDFDFIQGRAYSIDEFEAGDKVAVINKRTQLALFADKSAIDQQINIENQVFTIIGVVENVPIVEATALADVWLPYTTNASTAYQQETTGDWVTLLYHSNPDIIKDVNTEFVNLLENDVQLDKSSGFSIAIAGAYSKLEQLSRELIADDKSHETHTGLVISLMIGLTVAFMLLPSINMINLNVSRMMERSSEIGVRRAFGATKLQLLMQFIVESILLTLVGGIIGILLSVFALYLIDVKGLIPHAHFSFNLRVLLIGLVLIFIFGLVSGVYPAYRMSRLHPIAALKGNN
ncbi:ABC transporter permease [Glaciecola petra]|uniref:FtsX-like permease family protein n=1 Tax=Glaciecola petra TaxID=3075602 RepID=A0ABU2ZXR6_9ALTE|nr:FtsX-like permease family protein [Aestuariibacter sp. P117]MDT0596359.1 FtsX-like permease family protein [Aestuariibacter sp. P117]